ncbi:MAG: cell envelope integrity protein CreD [Gammaproteobacteria bacterium]|nr:MAG: cell envelope integrity protein CreD [Gammaproteobacteria bacterium]
MNNVLFRKLAFIGVIMALLIIPLMMISGKITERDAFRVEAKNNVSLSWARSQKLMGPILVIPYSHQIQRSVSSPKTNELITRTIRLEKSLFILPESTEINSHIDTDTRYKGIYKIPVYTTQINVKGVFSKASIHHAMDQVQDTVESVSFEKAYLTTTISDPRGINTIPTLHWQAEERPFKPGSKLTNQNNGIHALVGSLEDLNTDQINFDFQIELRGTEQLSFIPSGKETQVQITSPWPHPQFTGSFLPHSRTIDSNGYQAHWKISSFASNISSNAQRCEQGDCLALFASEFGVKHINPVDVYLQSERSVKYGFLFIALSFVTFFIFEIIQKLSIHPIQYSLMGLAIALFYLLLVSLSEHIGFAKAYGIAAISCVSLLFYYLRFILNGLKQASAFCALLLLLYAILYIIISAEDFAFLMGGVLTFLTLSIVMITTRNIDWYQIGLQADDKKQQDLRNNTAPGE